jgi:hypothetical protein
VCQARDIYFETLKNHIRTDLLLLGVDDDDSRALSDVDLAVGWCRRLSDAVRVCSVDL